MHRLTFRTAGESHGRGLVALLLQGVSQLAADEFDDG